MEHYDLLFKNGHIVCENEVIKADLAITAGKIVNLTVGIPEHSAKQCFDISNLHIFPGVIDSHVHLNEPGRTEWEGITTGSRSLAAGGVTTYFDMPLNSTPPTTTVRAYLEKKQLSEQKALINFKLWGGLVPGNIDQLAGLKECGVIGFKAFMSGSGIDDFQAVDGDTLQSGMEQLAKLDMILALHAESDHINLKLTEKIIAEGRFTGKDYQESRPVSSELEAVRKVIRLAKKTDCKVHIVHASSSRVVELIERAKQEGVNITVETCPHYLVLTVEDLTRLGALAKCAPPLREANEVELLWENLKAGFIDMIGSDHSPAPLTLKQGNLFKAWGGISGGQSTLNVLLEEGYWKHSVPLELIGRLTSTNPAKRFCLYPAKGSMKIGSDADFVIIDLQKKFTLQKAGLFYRHPHSPYVGKSFRGKILATFVLGKCVFRDQSYHSFN
ncbi:allantoinase AllB [Bacillus sp. DNRA2]|uniref:allantoinase AllB n=1 Tax=Bacillus sp. DNRA2 TaxID=2723053 RepID=UPI00145D4116|nr:allantoinase AllB [Bacillus sp. DNRA2]NMD69908.1 allantoinase AllB [Bacillus sp. DNRA2]